MGPTKAKLALMHGPTLSIFFFFVSFLSLVGNGPSLNSAPTRVFCGPYFLPTSQAQSASYVADAQMRVLGVY